jgi:RsiW-degrading membrane proteinase PrsW (M82 family)
MFQSTYRPDLDSMADKTINRKKLFLVTFTLSAIVLFVYGALNERPGAFPTSYWYMAYLALLGFWASLAASASLAILITVENLPRIAAFARFLTQAVGRWFTS